MSNLVLYHDNCPDGFTAAWVCWKKFGDTAEYRPVNYGQDIPTDHVVADRDVYLVDFCYPVSFLDVLTSYAKSVTVFDHHKTAEEALRAWDGGRKVFDMNRSGAGITHDELFPHVKRPKLVNYVEDRDLWKWALPNSREVSEYLFIQPYEFHAWNYASHLIERAPQSVFDYGTILLQAKRQRVAQMCKRARPMTFRVPTGMERRHESLTIPIVNASWDFSEIGEYLCEQYPEAPCGGYYFDREDGNRQWGFRSRGDFDCSVLAKAYGGGGHHGAAGFTSAIGWLPA